VGDLAAPQCPPSRLLLLLPSLLLLLPLVLSPLLLLLPLLLLGQLRSWWSLG